MSFWDERYQGEAYLFGEAPNAFLAAQAHRLKSGLSALAVADGEGRNGVWLAEQGLDVLSVDSSPVAQAKAARLARARGTRLRIDEVDLASWAWPDAQFDLVVAIFIQFAGPELRDEIFAGMKRALKPGGLLLLEGYRPEQIAYGTGGPRVPENLYTEALLRAAFSDFELLELSVYDAVIEEGAGHSGPSALIDLIARRPG
ncbi:MAG: methyltransferase domain-containing protein [Phenylobacterium sp.]|uniref:SAM-dependent methyltransferase n=1 Tax=Phenylobacterium sp. TaxID=1871053 RepID=UPI0027239378|nr:class I SAM-dependent methyltransferase [Phenylobacterium sp.]MDO8410490.1 methyltransferase domain-containing protein [Phenylobacterium sp.]